MKRFQNFSFLVLSLLVAACAFGQTAPAPKSAAPKMAAAAVANPVDINSASAADLKAVPGIGDAYAAKIIAGRPYKTKAQLKSRNILPAGVYEKVKANLVATQK